MKEMGGGAGKEGLRVRRGEVERWIVGKGEGERGRERGLSPALSYLSSLVEF